MSFTGITDDKELLAGVLALDQQALATVFDTYFDPLYGYIYRRVRDSGLAEDLAAEVFKRLLDQIERGRGPREYLKSYLYRIANNLVIDHARRQKYRNHDELHEDIREEAEPISQQVFSRILFEEARAALDQLDERQQVVIRMKFLEGLTNKEIAETMKVTVATIKALQHRGLKKLRTLLVKTAPTGETI